MNERARYSLSILFFFLLFGFANTYAQPKTGILYGTVKNEKGHALEGASVSILGQPTHVLTDARGTYSFAVPAAEDLTIVFSFFNAEAFKKNVQLQADEKLEINVRLKSKENVLIEFEKTTKSSNNLETGSVYMDAKEARYIPSTVGGIEGMIKMLTGSNNEMTAQYSVRGGNYDENLVYVNDFEIYRPFLARSGQQEGLSFVNTEMVSNVNFSIGGFQAKYGDKMSSVLDVTYKRPKKFGGSVTASLLGAGLHLEGSTKNEKLTYLLGVRQKSNQYLLQSQPTKGVYNPSFTDFQGLVNYRFNTHWEMEIIGNYARNRFSFVPEEMVSSFGLINQAYQLRIFYDGQEIDQFDTKFAGISTTYRPNERTKLKLLASAYQTDERETFDIQGEYLLGELETDMAKENFGQVRASLGTGIIHNFARNYLNINVGTFAHKGQHAANKHFIQWGADATVINIADRLHEWERRDSAGFTQPYQEDRLDMTTFYNARTQLSYMRISGYLQDNIRFNDTFGLSLAGGVRFNYSTLNGELNISPRLQMAYQPRSNKDLVLKASAGKYVQSPFYREMRDLDGSINTGLLAQKSYHFIAGMDYNFKIGQRPFKVTAEGYYKYMWDLVPYKYDNVRIRYFGENSAVGYAYGGEVRLYGEIVKDAPSWLSIGLLKTAEDLNNDSIVYRNAANTMDSAVAYPGYLARPNDQRVVFGMYFQDYLPRNKNFRMHLNLIYATGLPFGPPGKQRYTDVLRLPDYKRVDIGFSALLLNGEKQKERSTGGVLNAFKEIWASLEVFNLLGIQNTISYSWIQDQTSGRTFAVPNRLTSRLLNVKLIFSF